MKQVQTDNAFFEEKVLLRLESLPEKPVIKVLDCFSGNGLLWAEVKKRSGKTIQVLRMDEKPDREGVYLKGNNTKYLASVDLSLFDIIDLDAYGSPFKQLEIIFKRRYSGIIHVTFIQSMMGVLNKNMLMQLCYTDKMIKKIPSLFNKNGLTKLLEYLYLKGSIEKVRIFSNGRKNYFWFYLVN